MSSFYDLKGEVVETVGDRFYIIWNRSTPPRQGPYYQNELSLCRTDDVNHTDYNKGDVVIWTDDGVMVLAGIILSTAVTTISVRWKRQGYFSDYVHPNNESRIVKVCGEGV
jgi:hypothetical protein